MDEYTIRDDHGLIVFEGDRLGSDRRLKTDRRIHDFLSDVASHNRRKPLVRRDKVERRVGSRLSLKDVLYEHASSIFIGLVIILAGIFLLITGMTFLPIVGIYAGIFMLIAGCGFLVTAFIYD